MGTSSELDEIDEAVRQFAKNYFREREAAGENNSQLAKRLGRLVGKAKGFSRTTMTEISKDRRGIGKEMARALAADLCNGSWDKLQETALAWWVSNKERVLAMQRGKFSTAEKTYPNRGDALDRVDGVVDSEAVRFVRRMRLEPEKKDLPVLEWMSIALEEHHRLERGIKSTPPPPMRRR